ncbi:MAG: acetylpolyamine amidohydrolase [Acidimicrobiia bacterium]|nr:MAG: acetylpolyamine amidohydrolase [Acidimicrobiia bacterium]
MSLVAVWTAEHRLHDPDGEVWLGVRVPGSEVPERGEVLRRALEEAGVEVHEPTPHGRESILAVHDQGMVSYLEDAYRGWVEAGYTENPGQNRVVPYVFPHPDAIAEVGFRLPASRGALAGVYCMDTATLIGPGTFAAAVAAVDCALTAADMVLNGADTAYAAVRPPGHHAGTTFFGGSCYLNNAAIAAQYLIDAGAGPVGIVDIDAHHGNGTQQIFYRRAEVSYASVHVDPDRGWFPHFLGRGDERGAGPGAGANLNLPLPPGTGDEGWVEAVKRAVEFTAGRNPEVVVVSLGVDPGAADPESPLRVSNVGFAEAGELLAGLGTPAILVQEGGYDLDSLGPDVMAILTPFRPRRLG